MILRRDDLYTRAWEREHGKPIFDNNQIEPDVPNSLTNTIQSDLVKDKTSTILGTIRKNCPEVVPQANGIHDGTDTDQDRSYTRDASLEHPNPDFTEPQNTNYNLRYDMKSNWQKRLQIKTFLYLESFLSINPRVPYGTCLETTPKNSQIRFRKQY